MYRVVTGATGLIGKQLVKHWLKQNHTVAVIGRSIPTMEKTFGSTVKAITWDNLKIDDLKSAEVVVNLAGANAGDARWTEARKKEILNSRVECTKKLAELMAQLGTNSPALFNASAVSIYGFQYQLYDGLPPLIDEHTKIEAERLTAFLGQVAYQWEAATEIAKQNGVRVVFLRFGVVLAKEGGALPKIALPFQFFLGGKVGTGHQAFSWVSIDDLIRAIDFLLTHPELSGPFNVVAPECVNQRDLTLALGKTLNRPTYFPKPAFLMKAILGEQMATEVLLEGQHAYPKRLLEQGFTFEYPTIASALKHIYQQ